ncbi:hypothetical protein [Leyella stercorea]|uniref:hypothetical protein n=1 Tax=Leyella stercorea TaxID=363265 RepID=UPI0024330F90|nr:hypothetical protein [Leyella stercorea]
MNKKDMAYKKGQDRRQMVLFPDCIDEYVEADAPVCLFDAFVDNLKMDELGFVRSTPAETGTPGYDPRDLLKLYIYDVSKIGYDKFEQRTYLKYCNGAETFYTYDPQCRTMARTTTTMWMARWCSISSMFLSVKSSLRSAITFQIIH